MDFILEKRFSPRLKAIKNAECSSKRALVDEPNNDCNPIPPPKGARRKKQHADDDNSQKNKKKYEGYRCSPHKVVELVRSLSETQKQWVLKIGFGSLLTMKHCVLPRALTLWLINQVNCDSGCLQVQDQPFPIKPAIHSILGIPKGKKSITFLPIGRHKSKSRKRNPGANEFRASSAGRGMAVHEAIQELLLLTDEEKFCRSFMLIVLCLYIAPTSGHVINKNYLDTLSNINSIPELNWCDFAADYLIEGIKEYKQ